MAGYGYDRGSRGVFACSDYFWSRNEQQFVQLKVTGMVRNERLRSRDAHVRRSREFMLLKMVMIAVYGDDRELQCVEQL